MSTFAFRGTRSRFIAFACAPVFIGISCSNVPYTNRSQFNVVSESQERQLGVEAYAEVKSKEKLITSGADYEMVKRVAQRIAAAADSDAKDRGHALNFEWEAVLIESKDVNAWCLPGGKMGVYTGILPVTKTEAGLAVVMGHEVSHAVARHGAERMSQGAILDIALEAANAGLGNQSAGAREAVMTALGAGANVGVMLPFSRDHESEADHIGLILMAKAGYDPREGPKLWERMREMSGEGPAEFLSTHPAPTTRIKDMEKWMPEALQYYNKTGGVTDAKNMDGKNADAKNAAAPTNSKAPAENATPAAKTKKP